VDKPQTPSDPLVKAPADPPGATSGAIRDRAADERDRITEARDEVAEERDDRADARDERADAHARTSEVIDLRSAADRAAAGGDRQAAADDRHHSHDDQTASRTDRQLSAVERARFTIDELTGAYHREPGLVELERDVERAERTRSPFVLAFIDVVGLKTTNDALGHEAGDQRLREVVETIRRHVRSYDRVVRLGGDEFLCGMLDLDLDRATGRFEAVNADLAASQQGPITTGLAELAAHEGLTSLIRRADGEMYRKRGLQTAPTEA
jgi:diguanylate cyclase (GGDEF)-like protein